MTDETTTAHRAATPVGGPAVVRVDWDDPRAVALRDAMGAEMGALYGDLPPSAEVERALAVDPADVLATFVALDGDGGADGAGAVAVGHVALRRLGGEFEVKRLVVRETHRRRGISQALMGALEDAARALGATRLVLQTGDRQTQAVALYESTGWRAIPVFPPYEVLAVSLCYAKDLTA